MAEYLNGVEMWGGAVLKTTTLKLQDTATVWDDMQVNISLGRVPASNAPSWTTYNFGVAGGLAFAVLGFGINEYLDFTIQSSHSMQLNTVMDTHIHYVTPTNDSGKRIKFQLDAVAAAVNTTFAVPTGSPYSAEIVLGAASASTHGLLEIGELAAVNSSVSTIYLCRLTRISASANDYGSDVYVTYIDCHYEKDSLGSETEYVK